jgi:hypothetical protein
LLLADVIIRQKVFGEDVEHPSGITSSTRNIIYFTALCHEIVAQISTETKGGKDDEDSL